MDYIEHYLTYLEHTQRTSPRTVETYTRALSLFKKAMDARGVAVEKATNADVQSFVTEMKDAGRAPATIHNRAVIVRSFFRYLIKHELVPGLWRNPAKSLSMPRVKPSNPAVLTPPQVEQFIAFDDSTFSGVRNRAIFEVLYSTGARISELCGANVADLDLEAATLMIRVGKGRKQRLTFLTDGAVEAVRVYLDVRGAHVDPDDPDAAVALWLNVRKHRISSRGVFSEIDNRIKLLRRSGVEIPEGVGPHTFRHSFATALYDSGADLEVIQKLLGHSLARTTALYIHPGPERTRAVYNAAHPHAHDPAAEPVESNRQE